VVRAFDWSEPLLELEYIDGGDLRQRLRNGPMAPGEVLGIALQFCQGMQFLFSAAGIVHRDIKPENILLTQAGCVKITDFGIAKALTNDLALGMSPELRRSLHKDAQKFIAGTPPYMSPEQYLGVDALSTASDVYAFGVVLYEMLSGRKPFAATTFAELRHLHLTATPVAPASLVPTLGAHVSAVVMKCLEKSPSRRFSDFSELGDALRECASEASEESSTPLLSVPEPATPPITAIDWYVRSRVHQKGKDYAAALKAATMARTAEPALAGMRIELARSLLRLGRLREAIEQVREEQLQVPASAAAHGLEAEVYLAARRFREALSAAEKASALAPEIPENCCLLIRCAAAANETRTASKASAQLLLIYTMGRRHCLYECLRCGYQMAQQRFFFMANMLFGHATQLHPESPVAWFNWGVFCHLSGNLGVAHQHYTKALELDALATEAWVNRGWAQFERKDYPGAVADFRAALGVDPGNAFTSGLEGAIAVLSAPEAPSESGLKFLAFWRNLIVDYYL
jgi:tetratricopeptide (TPR) repeat protein